MFLSYLRSSLRFRWIFRNRRGHRAVRRWESWQIPQRTSPGRDGSGGAECLPQLPGGSTLEPARIRKFHGPCQFVHGEAAVQFPQSLDVLRGWKEGESFVGWKQISEVIFIFSYLSVEIKLNYVCILLV